MAVSRDETASAGQSSIEITVLYFASARTAVDSSSEKLKLPPGTALSKLSHIILERYNESGELKKVLDRSAWSVNEEIVYDPENTTLKQGDVVAVLPPVSGG